VDNDGPDAMRKHSFKEGEYRRVELITGQKRRRDWTAKEKAEILAATMVPGASVTEVARRFSIGPTLVWTWRRKAMAEMAVEMGPRFVPLRIEGEATGSAAAASEPPSRWDQPVGSIEVAIGRARVRVEGAVDPEVLRQILGLIGPAR
jgi:transposase